MEGDPHFCLRKRPLLPAAAFVGSGPCKPVFWSWGAGSQQGSANPQFGDVTAWGCPSLQLWATAPPLGAAGLTSRRARKPDPKRPLPLGEGRGAPPQRALWLVGWEALLVWVLERTALVHWVGKWGPASPCPPLPPTPGLRPPRRRGLWVGCWAGPSGKPAEGVGVGLGPGPHPPGSFSASEPGCVVLSQRRGAPGPQEVPVDPSMAPGLTEPLFREDWLQESWALTFQLSEQRGTHKGLSVSASGF